jgi:nucleoid DNA-binding protein
MKVTQKTLTANISEKTGLNTYRSKKALQTALNCIKEALRIGKQIDLDKLGKLKVVARKPARRINKNLRLVGPNIEDVHKKHPKTVRLLLVFVAVVMVTTGQEIIENKIAHIITQSLASILVEAEMLTG